MYLYRIVDKHGNGMYRGGGDVEEDSLWISAVNLVRDFGTEIEMGDDLLHPMPQDSSMLYGAMSTRLYFSLPFVRFAFPTMNALKRWVHSPDLRAAMNLMGGKIVKLEIPDEYCVSDGVQAIYQYEYEKIVKTFNVDEEEPDDGRTQACHSSYC